VASGQRLRPDYGDYDHIAALLRYERGVVGMLSYSSYLPPGHNHFHIYGTGGTIAVERDRLVVASQGKPPQAIGLPEEHTHVVMWRAMLQALHEGRDPAYAPGHALRDVAILEAIDQAIRTDGRAAVSEA
jgi:predicted dehydrogenase